MQPQQQQNNGNSLLVEGRIVWTSGNLFEGKKQTDDNNQVVLDQNGQPVIQFGFGLSIPKYNPGTKVFSEQFTKIWQALHAEAYTIYPSGQLPPDFAMKFKDGDAIDHNGQAFSTREGYAECIVLACTTQLPIKFFKWEGNGNVQIASGIKCGDYVKVQLNIKAHAPKRTAKGMTKGGLYLNPSAVQLIAAGREIINAPSGDQMFGTTAPSYSGEIVPPSNPVMPGAQIPPMNGQPQYQVAPPVQQPQYQQPVDPNYSVLPPQHQPQQYQQQPPQMPPMQQQYQAAPPVQQPQYQQPPVNNGMPAMPPMR